MTLKQFEKKSRGSLMRFINGYLKTQSKKHIAVVAYTLAKSKLPRLKTTKQKALPNFWKSYSKQKALPKRKAKRKKMTKAEKKKFLSRLNKGRKKAGLKPIRAKR